MSPDIDMVPGPERWVASAQTSQKCCVSRPGAREQGQELEATLTGHLPSRTTAGACSRPSTPGPEHRYPGALWPHTFGTWS